MVARVLRWEEISYNMSLSLFFFESLRESFLYFNFNVNLSNILVKRVFNFLILFIMLTWKIVRVSKDSVIYIYIYIYRCSKKKSLKKIRTQPNVSTHKQINNPKGLVYRTATTFAKNYNYQHHLFRLSQRALV